MARIWQEGFEHNAYLHGEYWESNAYADDMNIIYPATDIEYKGGRNAYSQKSLQLTYINTAFYKFFDTSLTDFYLRVYINAVSVNTDSNGGLFFYDNSDTKVFQMTEVSTITNVSSTYNIYVYKSSALTLIGTITLNKNQWYRLEIHYKKDASTGVLELKLDGTSEITDTSINTTLDVDYFKFGGWTTSSYPNWQLDDLAVNDTSGTINNSWPGSGTIVSLIPNGAGNYSQWDNSEGYWTAESGTTTTNVTLTGHGLATGDFAYNITRGTVREITLVDANNFTVSSVTGQTTSDIIVLYKLDTSYTAQTGTGSNVAKLLNADIDVYDLLVQDSTKNYGRVVAISGDDYYVDYSTLPALENVTFSSGDTVNVHKVHRSTITNHYEAVNQTKPNHQYARLRTPTSGDIDTFDMEELVTDKSLPSLVEVKAVRHLFVAKDLGEGSQIKPVFRISSTDYEGTTRSLINKKQLLYDTIYDLSPATSAQWTQSEVDGLEAGIKKV